MILICENDIKIIEKFLLEKFDLQSCNKIVKLISEERGVVPPEVFKVDKYFSQPCFVIDRWEIYVDDDRLSFLHELAHYINLIDNGHGGSEKDAESFAHGINNYLNSKENGENISEEEAIKNTLFISEVLKGQNGK